MVTPDATYLNAFSEHRRHLARIFNFSVSHFRHHL